MKKVRWSRVFGVALFVVIAGVAIYALVAMNGNPGMQTYVEVGDQPVTLAEVERGYALIEPQFRENLSMHEYVDEILVPRTLLLLEAEEKGFEVPEEQVDGTVEIIKAGLSARNLTFEDYLASMNASEEELRSDIRENTLINRIIEEEIASKVEVTANEIERVYDNLGYAEMNISYDQARYTIGPQLVVQKQNEALRLYVKLLRDRYGITYHMNGTQI